MKPRNPFAPITYTIMDELMASPTHPLPEKSRLHQLTVMWQGLAALETAPHPTKNDWRVVSDAVNLMETFIRTMGFPSSYQLPERAKDAMHMLGNAVVPMVARDVIQALRAAA